jgi:hypothetical protein
MSDYIPFVNSSNDWSVALSIYPDSTVFRIAIQSVDKTSPHMPDGSKLWVDAGVDGLHNWPFEKNAGYLSYFQQFPDAARIVHPSFHAKPDKKIAESFVSAVLDFALTRVPHAAWLTVPQLP